MVSSRERAILSPEIDPERRGDTESVCALTS